MALDDFLLSRASDRCSAPTTFLRLYQWDRPTLSLGISQKAERVVDFDFCREHGIGLVRRLTGGKAVLHHRELTYAVISNDPFFFPTKDICGTYRRIATALQAGFCSLGLSVILGASQPTVRHNLSRACFTTLNHHEITVGDRKLVGSAQRRTQTSFLQHGSIPYVFDSKLLAGALGLKDCVEITSRATDLRRCLGEETEIRDVANALISGFEMSFNVQLAATTLSDVEWQVVKQIRVDKYEDLNWNVLPKLA